jgi:hypothetical protein
LNEYWALYILLILGHLTDMIYTVLYIRLSSKYIEKSNDLELNFHSYFFKKFGLIKGACISSTISLSILSLCYYLLIIPHWNKMLVGFLCGFQWGIGYVNFRSYYSAEDIYKNLKLKKKKR